LKKFQETALGILLEISKYSPSSLIEPKSLLAFVSLQESGAPPPLRLSATNILTHLLNSSSLTLQRMISTPSLISTLFSRTAVVSDELLSFALEITNQSLKHDDQTLHTVDRNSDQHTLFLPLLIRNNLLSFLASSFTTLLEQNNLEKKTRTQVVKTLQAIMRSDEKYVTMVSTLNLPRLTIRAVMKGYQS
jgi:hypothetical protein